MSEEITITEVNEVTSYTGDKAAIDVQVSTARAYPRNVRKCVDNAIAIVTMDSETAATCNYAVPRGGKSITGPSVHLAKILANQWGNIRCEARVVEVDNKRVTSEGICWDLENNVAIKATVKRSILTRSGRMSEDMITVTGNAANSIALRNAILSVIPKAVVDKVYKAAIQTITGDVSTENKLVAKRAKVIKALVDAYTVTEEEILNAVGKSSTTHLGADELAVLIGIGQAIKDGDTTVDEAFRGKKQYSAPTAEKVEKDTERQRIVDACNEAETAEDLDLLLEVTKDSTELNAIVVAKMNELKSQGK